jgi:hypothetical protein
MQTGDLVAICRTAVIAPDRDDQQGLATQWADFEVLP